jgi:hypothetical protein
MDLRVASKRSYGNGLRRKLKPSGTVKRWELVSYAF